MKNEWLYIITIVCVFSFIIFSGQASSAETVQGNPHISALKQISITGQFVKTAHGYIIRGQTPRNVFEILNPDPGVLDALVAAGRTVLVEARIVLGDHIKIQKIDDKVYP